MKAAARNVTELDAAIGKRIAERRCAYRMSRPVLARQIGVTFQQVEKYETGANRIPASRLFLIAKALQCGVEYFYPPPTWTVRRTVADYESNTTDVST